jgi:virginiamycin B lyase
VKPLRYLFFVILVVGVACQLRIRNSFAQPRPEAGAALSGQVTSTQEGAMEGVLVTVKEDNSSISHTVYTDAHGRYVFPSANLEPGHYSIKIRAAGYDLDSPAAVDLPAEKNAAADIKLRKTANLAAQLTNAEWLYSMPGTDQQKAPLRNCTVCHTLIRPLGSSHNADEFVAVQHRMAGYVNQSIPLKPQRMLAPRLADQIIAKGEDSLSTQADVVRKQAEFLASANLSKGSEYSYPLKTFPRPTGNATHAFITEYQLPVRTRQPHDVYVDSDGMVWYISFGEQVLGRMDPKTGAVKEFTIPTLRPEVPTGELALRPDEDGNLWIAMMYQGAVGKFDRKTEKFQTWSLPSELIQDYTQVTEVNAAHSKVDGKVWLIDSGTYTIYRLDPVTGKFETLKPFPDPSPNVYDISPDAQNNAYFTVFGADQVGRVDAKTKEITVYKTPTKNSNPRRGELAANGLFWFGEFGGNRIGMFNTKDLSFKEWTPPSPWAFPYNAVADKNGDVWSGSTMTDRLMRLDPKTDQIIEYLMPNSTNIRKVFVDNSTNPVTVWFGNNHAASIIKVELQK